MTPELAAFRLHALSGLINSNGAGVFQQPRTGASFDAALLAARGLSVAAPRDSAIQPTLMQPVQQGHDMLARLEQSNLLFLRRFNARVAEIGTEAGLLGKMRERMMELGSASASLENLAAEADSQQVGDKLQRFISRYNVWDAEFDPYFEPGALLDGNQAGDLARFSLRRELGSIFHGVGNDGFERGLTDIGVSIQPDGQLRLDRAEFDAMFARSADQVRQTLRNMAGAFRESAQLLTSDGHLLARRVGNAQSAVAWASSKQAELEAEFGPGAATSRLLGKA